MLLYFVNGVIDEVLKDGTYMQWFEEARKRAEELGM
jgi:polar amino acid transport system substrate-binding protein